MELDTDATLMLGRGNDDEVIERTRRFVRTLPALQRDYPGPLSHADVRYPEAYAVKLRGTTTLQDDLNKPGVTRKPCSAPRWHWPWRWCSRWQRRSPFAG